MTTVGETKRYRFVPAYRITTFVPTRYVPRVLKAVLGVVPLAYGREYDRVAWWSVPGTEQYRPLAGSRPRSGKPGRQSRVRSIALTFSIPRNRTLLARVVRDGIMPTHPWDEPVIVVSRVVETRRIRPRDRRVPSY
ncbi:MAG: hypothetical protein Q7R80_03425 [bacterium]|nr:hypothetical protein [bacterium]